MPAWWFDAMAPNPRLVEGRMVWFWHEHFATRLGKVQPDTGRARRTTNP